MSLCSSSLSIAAGFLFFKLHVGRGERGKKEFCWRGVKTKPGIFSRVSVVTGLTLNGCGDFGSSVLLPVLGGHCRSPFPWSLSSGVLVGGKADGPSHSLVPGALAGWRSKVWAAKPRAWGCLKLDNATSTSSQLRPFLAQAEHGKRASRIMGVA